MKILDEFLPELTAPVAAIYREAIATHTWPDPFKMEYHLPINKVPIPQSEEDLRNLGLTPFISKRLEWFLSTLGTVNSQFRVPNVVITTS